MPCVSYEICTLKKRLCSKSILCIKDKINSLVFFLSTEQISFS